MKKIRISTIAGRRIEQSRKSGKRIISHKHAYPSFILSHFYIFIKVKKNIFTKRLIIMFSRLTHNK